MEQHFIEALTILAYMVIGVAALGLAEVALNMTLGMLDKLRRITGTGIRL